jgi:hypothetical protein
MVADSFGGPEHPVKNTTVNAIRLIKNLERLIKINL